MKRRFVYVLQQGLGVGCFLRFTGQWRDSQIFQAWGINIDFLNRHGSQFLQWVIRSSNQKKFHS